MSPTAVLVYVGSLGFLALSLVAALETRRAGASAWRQLQFPLVALLLGALAVRWLHAGDARIALVFGLALCIGVALGGLVLAVVGLPGAPRGDRPR